MLPNAKALSRSYLDYLVSTLDPFSIFIAKLCSGGFKMEVETETEMHLFQLDSFIIIKEFADILNLMLIK